MCKWFNPDDYKLPSGRYRCIDDGYHKKFGYSYSKEGFLEDACFWIVEIHAGFGKKPNLHGYHRKDVFVIDTCGGWYIAPKEDVKEYDRRYGTNQWKYYTEMDESSWCYK